jgi:putative sugar O-methyltransferase
MIASLASARAVTFKMMNKAATRLPIGIADRLGLVMSETARALSPEASGTGFALYLRRAGQLLKSSTIPRRMAAIDELIRDEQFDQAARIYREVIGIQPTLSTTYDSGVRLAESGRMGDAFTQACIHAIETPELREMMSTLLLADPIFQPSRLWLYFMIYNAFQIETGGIEHFKKTVNHNYFNWTSDYDIELQSRSLQSTLGLSDTERENLARDIDAPEGARPAEFSRAKWQLYSRFLALLWEQAARSDRLGLLDSCAEPELGDPLSIRYRGRLITQDLCNSVIDVNTMFAGAPGDLKAGDRVAEIGAGHGRIENILLRAAPGVRVAIFDIPPALYVSQWYLSHLFPNKRVFKFRDFDRFDQVKAEFEAADIAFFLPSQARLLPEKTFDAFVNICSLQEMTSEQIDLWFSEIDRLCRGWFFTKQYMESHNHFDHIVVRRADYPVRRNWTPIFDRGNPGNTSLFEALYAIEKR